MRPVVVLARAVDAGEGFFVEEAGEAVLVGDAAEGFHREHLVIVGEIGVFIDRGDFVLRRCDFVVAGLDGNAELVEFMFGFQHAGQNAFRDAAEIMVFHFLALGRLGAEERAAGVDQVGAGVVEIFVDEEVFLLRTDGGEDFFAKSCRRA